MSTEEEGLPPPQDAPMPAKTHAAACEGCVIGAFIGDALGAPVEMSAGADIQADPLFAARGVREMHSMKELAEKRNLAETLGMTIDELFATSPTRDAGMYTDDTFMLLTLCEALVESYERATAEEQLPGLDELCAQKLIVAWRENEAGPAAGLRGFSPATQQVVQALAAGEITLAVAGTHMKPDGSMGNGGAMRIAPVGLVCARSLGATRTEPAKVVAISTLRKRCADAISATHVHPNGIDGAVVVAFVVAQAATHGTAEGGQLDPPELLSLLAAEDEAAVCTTSDMRDRLCTLCEQWTTHGELSEPTEFRWDDEASRIDMAVAQMVSENTETNKPGFIAVDAAAIAVWMFLRHRDQPIEALVRTIALGGDTDTLACIVGAMVGAYAGVGWWADNWWTKLENGPRGRDFARALSRRVAEIGCKIESGVPTATSESSGLAAEGEEWLPGRDYEIVGEPINARGRAREDSEFVLLEGCNCIVWKIRHEAKEFAMKVAILTDPALVGDSQREHADSEWKENLKLPPSDYVVPVLHHFYSDQPRLQDYVGTYIEEHLRDMLASRTLFMVMPFYPNGSLRRFIEAHREPELAPPFKLSWKWFGNVLLQQCCAVQILLDHGIIHGDIKADQFFVDSIDDTGDVTVRLGDFGESWCLHDDDGVELALTSREELTTRPAGVGRYKAPELRGRTQVPTHVELQRPLLRDIYAKAETFSVGVTLYCELGLESPGDVFHRLNDTLLAEQLRCERGEPPSKPDEPDYGRKQPGWVYSSAELPCLPDGMPDWLREPLQGLGAQPCTIAQLTMALCAFVCSFCTAHLIVVCVLCLGTTLRLDSQVRSQRGGAQADGGRSCRTAACGVAGIRMNG